jgi:hypothetical protein
MISFSTIFDDALGGLTELLHAIRLKFLRNPSGARLSHTVFIGSAKLTSLGRH